MHRPLGSAVNSTGLRHSRRSPFLVHLAALIVISIAAFMPSNEMLLISIDGEFTRVTSLQLGRYAAFFPGLSMAPFEGMGTLFHMNPLITPSLAMIAIFGERIGVTLAYVVSAGLMFCSTFLVGRALTFPRGGSLLAAWTVTILCLPYRSLWGFHIIYIYSLNTLGADNVSFVMVLIALFAQAFTTRYVRSNALAFFLVGVWLFLANAAWLILSGPIIGLSMLGILYGNNGRERFASRAAWHLIPLTLFVALGGAAYIFGIYLDTAASFYFNELSSSTGAPVWRLATVAGTDDRVSILGGTWVVLALGGAALAILRGSRLLGAIAASFLALGVLFCGYIFAYMAAPVWVVPFPIYFEYFMWPLYSLFGAYAVTELGKAIARRWGAYYPSLTQRDFPGGRPVRFAAIAAGTAGVAACLLLFPFRVANPYYEPGRSTAITARLQSDIGIGPGLAFKGYVATLSGFGGPFGPPADWNVVLNSAARSMLAFGNFHRLPYLWRFDIPTFEPYSQTAEPALFGLVTRLLDRPQDGQIRNILIVTQARFPLMESLGIRYLITDYPLAAPAEQVDRMAQSDTVQYLFRLPDTNLATYAPTEVVVADNATEVLRDLARPQFDFHKTVVLGEPVEQPLQAAVKSDSSLVRGGWRVAAQSEGRSLLLVPLQFSHCLEVHPRQTGGGRVIAIQRANLASTALVFEGSVDVELSLRVSPFWRPFCRLQDAHEMRRFGLAEIPRIVEDAQP
ncbi:MAG: hypothetical protein ABR970_07180 [Roseiarcus sp.]|jgi:hypothetical protein